MKHHIETPNGSKSDNEEGILVVYKCICKRRSEKTSNPCSNYCAYLPPGKQRDIILSEKWKTSKSSENSEIWYAISAKWWKKWCDFVNIEYQEITSPALEKVMSAQNLEGDYYQQDNTSESPRKVSSQNLKYNEYQQRQEVTQSVISITELYDRPDRINNSEICEYSDEYLAFTLKNNVQELYDYIRVNHLVWRYIKRWYGYDHEVIINP